MNRRDCVRNTALVSAGAALTQAGAFGDVSEPPLAVRLSVGQPGKTIAQDFTGLSYESAQLSDPGFFSGANTRLIGMMRGLGKEGVLRIGGNTSEYCFWAPEATAAEQAAMTGQGPMGPDPGHKPAVDRRITPLAVRNLRDFVYATGWKLIYGLNMGKGTAADAAAEASYVLHTIGPEKLIGFQLCNEPDLFARNGIRKADYNAQQFNEEWKQFYDAIKAREPLAPFAGPDTAYGQQWLVPFASRFKSDVKFLSSHYYAEGPPTDPAMTIERLFTNPGLEAQLAGMQQVLSQTGLPFRLAETNSCYAAGKQGVSDTFAAALWSADLMYQVARAGGMGINFHGGGYGWYTPIAGTPEHGFVARPVYYGMLLFAEAGAGRLLEVTLDAGEALTPAALSAYAVQAGSGATRILLFNKQAARGVRVSLNAGRRTERATALRLYAPRLEDTVDVTLGASQVSSAGAWQAAVRDKLAIADGQAVIDLPPGSAALVECS
ncbi:MAG TPA: glycosyl hydrolase family 79 C-terminal domain-containing protein [Acidobacteriaceae bacterium]